MAVSERGLTLLLEWKPFLQRFARVPFIFLRRELGEGNPCVTQEIIFVGRVLVKNLNLNQASQLNEKSVSIKPSQMRRFCTGTIIESLETLI